MIQIRKATIEDISNISQIAINTWADAYKEILSDEQQEYMLNMMYSFDSLYHQMNNSQTFLVAMSNEEIVGFLSYEVAYNNRNALKIHKYYVLPTMQGNGVGSALLKYVESIATSQNIEIITLNVNRFNKTIQHYLSKGFEITKSEDIDIGNGYLMEDFVMEKKIDYI
ncbi:MAG: GNAT family N-acetyltransferase [Candidatus Kapabacteria bacterium]|jgi:GNAT superfamily N-acetyltransferase|nr:GNAT family N-acetyltransferase [Candidatus Kapabacteria bacterium]